MSQNHLDPSIQAAIEEIVAPLRAEIAELKKIRRVNRWIIAGLVIFAVILAPLFAASLMSGNLGIGVASPADSLDVIDDIRIRGGEIKDAGGTRRVSLADGQPLNLYDPTGQIRVSMAPSGNTNWFDAGGSTRMSLENGGDVGIGISAPTERLDVRGNIKLGGSGQYFAPGGAENLRIIRGVVGSGGPSIAGSGFSSGRIAVGRYAITYSGAFSAIPAVTCSTLGTNSRCHTQNTTSGSIEIYTYNSAGTPSDTNFSFVSIGPR